MRYFSANNNVGKQTSGHNYVEMEGVNRGPIANISTLYMNNTPRRRTSRNNIPPPQQKFQRSQTKKRTKSNCCQETKTKKSRTTYKTV